MFSGIYWSTAKSPRPPGSALAEGSWDEDDEEEVVATDVDAAVDKVVAATATEVASFGRCLGCSGKGAVLRLSEVEAVAVAGALGEDGCEAFTCNRGQAGTDLLTARKGSPVTLSSTKHNTGT